jgi:hypothetical protein
VPIVPLYIEVPRTSNTGKSWVMKRTVVHVHKLPDIDTSAFRAEKARIHADEVRQVFQDFEGKLVATKNQRVAA